MIYYIKGYYCWEKKDKGVAGYYSPLGISTIDGWHIMVLDDQFFNTHWVYENGYDDSWKEM